MSGNQDIGVPISQSIVANVQLGLPSTVSKLSSKMRFIDKVAPLLKEQGVVRTLDLIQPLTIKCAGIATTNRTTNAFGGVLYISGAVRQDVLIQEGSIYQTKQESIVDVDEIDDLDSQKKLKFIDMVNAYKLLETTMEEENLPDLIILDVPLLLERADAPLDDRMDILKYYDLCRDTIAKFWEEHKDKIYPFNKNGVKIASIGTKRFGAIFFALTNENLKYVPDPLGESITSQLEKYMDNIRSVGIKRLLRGILVKRSRTAAFQFDGITNDNRMEPANVRDLGLIGMHIKAGNNTPPLLIEVLGKANDWDSEMLDTLCSEIMSLITFDQAKALPIPLWYAKYALKPIEARPGVLEYYKSHTKEMLKNEDLETIWKEDLDVYEE
ncbi:hypothetical protein [Clostridium cochlearium]|jgi:hypothetical protein|uniref:hypothetical protein n=1 Tax=Clostridium cochlearium TaxID=1494 RepID=UPI000BBCD6DC|nr:hypothetical protein [Clostridium cochlearium]MBE6063999.1 hypothetical protein [Clostridium cochlearium]MBE6082848.1 hypothetical protein [Tissierellaceae bacterium]